MTIPCKLTAFIDDNFGVYIDECGLVPSIADTHKASLPCCPHCLADSQSAMMQILTVWQASMAVVSTFPHPPEKLKDIVDALAEHHGEPSAASFQAAAADDSSDSVASLHNHIYKSKLMPPQFTVSTAVASQ